MDATTILYAMSTLAQTCAALAAFVGAIGLYRLQMLKERRAETERTIRRLLMPRHVSLDWAFALPEEEVVGRARRVVEANDQADRPFIPRLQELLSQWDAFPRQYQRRSRSLVIFVGWNLLAIFLSLVGFTFVPNLVTNPLASFGLWALSVGTVVVTGLTIFGLRR